mmetsp:Transcript_88063/g.146465  ORF Transcript_88063/g.146465 Transcript_88063/m.146465 type:complete len:240 (-) Transcript_88063:74-793(-)
MSCSSWTRSDTLRARTITCPFADRALIMRSPDVDREKASSLLITVVDNPGSTSNSSPAPLKLAMLHLRGTGGPCTFVSTKGVIGSRAVPLPHFFLMPPSPTTTSAIEKRRAAKFSTWLKGPSDAPRWNSSIAEGSTCPRRLAWLVARPVEPSATAEEIECPTGVGGHERPPTWVLVGVELHTRGLWIALGRNVVVDSRGAFMAISAIAPARTLRRAQRLESTPLDDATRLGLGAMAAVW